MPPPERMACGGGYGRKVCGSPHHVESFPEESRAPIHREYRPAFRNEVPCGTSFGRAGRALSEQDLSYGRGGRACAPRRRFCAPSQRVTRALGSVGERKVDTLEHRRRTRCAFV